MAIRFLIVCGGCGVDLLGQRRVLGVDAELQIDVTTEIDSSLERQRKRATDPRSLHVALDEGAKTPQELLRDSKDRFPNTPAGEQVKFLSRHWTGAEGLPDGLARSPLLGRLAASQPGVLKNLDGTLATMIEKYATNVGPGNPLEVWIISSTAGGTGEGTHRFVAERLIQVAEDKTKAYIKFNFVRIGPLTYRQVDFERTSINTFFGVAADAAFSLKTLFRFGTREVTTNWFYFDLPDVGATAAAKPIRAKIVATATKALMLPELQERLKTIVNNDGLLMALVRTGFWGGDFNENQKYFATLDELDKKVREELIYPDTFARYIDGKSAPEFVATTEFDQVLERVQNKEYVKDQMENAGWAFPALKQRGAITDDKLVELIADWKAAINSLINPKQIGSLGVSYQIEKTSVVEGQPRTEKVDLRAPSLAPDNKYDKVWFQVMDDSYRVQAWCTKLLGGPEGLKAQLIEGAKICSDAQNSWNPLKGIDDKATTVAQNLRKFVTLLEQVTFLLREGRGANDLVSREVAPIRDLHTLVIQQKAIAEQGAQGKKAPVVAAELSTELDQIEGRTWLGLLMEASAKENREVFREETMNGATGLKQAGLATILGLPDTADIREIRDALNAKWGRFEVKDDRGQKKVDEAQWWQVTPPPETRNKYTYRILPKLDEILKAKLDGGDRPADLSYLYTEIGVIGLSVLAFEARSIGSEGAAYTTPVYLMKPLMNPLRKELRNWKDSPLVGEPSGNLIIAKASCPGEPLYKKALEEVGLTPEDLKKIQTFYEIYDPNTNQ